MHRIRMAAGLALVLLLVPGTTLARSDQAYQSASCQGVDSSEWFAARQLRDDRARAVVAFAHEEGVPPGFFESSVARFCP